MKYTGTTKFPSESKQHLYDLFYQYELSRIKFNSFTHSVVYICVCACVHTQLTVRKRHPFWKDAAIIQNLKQWHPPLVNVKESKNTNDNN